MEEINNNNNNGEIIDEEPTTTATKRVFFDGVGVVNLSINPSGLSWKTVDFLNQDESSCFGLKINPERAGEIKFSDVYAAELIDWGPVREMTRYCFRNKDLQMYRCTIHAMQRCTTKPSVWQLAEYTFGHRDQLVCQTLVNQVDFFLNQEKGRPKRLLVFVNPKSGKANGQKVWGSVAPIFSRAKVRAQVTITETAGHAFDLVASMKNHELNSYDGIVAVGGDGLFNEILNGFLSTRLKTTRPPVPPDFMASLYRGEQLDTLSRPPNRRTEADAFSPSEDLPLLPAAINNESDMTNCRTENGVCSTADDDDVEFLLPHEWFRFGLIPAGSTDAIVICTTGARDPITSALHIVLGKRIGLDIAQVVRWKATHKSKVDPFVRYTASFVGYGFYGEVIAESEKYRWMGPKRYDFAGTKVFLRHRAYEAEVSYLDVNSDKTDPDAKEENLNAKTKSFWGRDKKRSRVICRANCEVCKPCLTKGESRWLTSTGHYLSVGAAVISCRNDKAPDGLVADAHLSDGFLHLILIKNCPHALYLWHLTHLARKGGSPLDFDFVEHHKTSAFTFTSIGKEGVWNLDGEVLEAHKLSAQVLRGLVSLFAAGPEV